MLSNSLLDRFSALASSSLSARMPNPALAAQPKVPVCTPCHGQDPSLPAPVSIVGCQRHFQGEGEDWVPSGPDSTPLSASGESRVRMLG